MATSSTITRTPAATRRAVDADLELFGVPGHTTFEHEIGNLTALRIGPDLIVTISDGCAILDPDQQDALRALLAAGPGAR